MVSQIMDIHWAIIEGSQPIMNFYKLDGANRIEEEGGVYCYSNATVEGLVECTHATTGKNEDTLVTLDNT